MAGVGRRGARKSGAATTGRPRERDADRLVPARHRSRGRPGDGRPRSEVDGEPTPATPVANLGHPPVRYAAGMFWTLVLPFQITFALLAAAYAAGVWAAPRLGVRRRWAAVAGPPLAVLAFVPLCLGVGSLCDAVRFGEFRYETTADVTAPEVARWLPDAATDIEVHRRAIGFEARYTIAEDDLRAWLDAEWARWGEGAAFEREPPEPVTSPSGGPRFRWADWPTPAGLIRFDGPRAANAAGFTVWYGPSEGRAYQDAGHW